MKVLFKKGLCLLCVVALLMSGVSVWAATTTENPKVYILGDSTACEYDSTSLRTGWGEALQNFLTKDVTLINAASSGDSSHSFYDEEWNWNTVKARLKKGDYVLIQFGHNDSAKSGTDDEGNTITDLSRYSNPTLDSTVAPPAELSTNESDYSYKWYLKQFIDTAKDAGAHPILVTSVERLKHVSGTEANSSLSPYVTAMEELGVELSVPVIDVWRGVRTGYTDSWYVSDGVHLAEAGAMEVARIFAKGVKESEATSAVGLARYLVDDVDSVSEHKDVLYINEDFEDYTVPNEESVYVGKPLSATISQDTNTTYGRVIAETDGNKAIKIVANSSTYTVSWNLPKALSSGYYKLSYSFRSDPSTSGSSMEFRTNVGTYNATTRYGRNSINNSSKDNLSDFGVKLTDGEWMRVDHYIDPTKGNLNFFYKGTEIASSAASGKSTLKNISSISIGFASGKSGTLYLDDIEFKELSKNEYDIAMGVLPSDITAMEDFEKAGTTAAVTSVATKQEVTIINKTNWGWVNTRGTNATHGGNRTITSAIDPDDADNTVAKFEGYLQEINDYNTLSFTPSAALTDGIYSVKFRLRAEDLDSNTFWVSAMDTGNSHRHYIAFAMGDDETYGDKVYMMTTVDGAAVEYAKPYDFELQQWYDIEIVYDLTPEDKIAASVYVEDTKLINGVTIGGGSYTNDGTINRIDFGIPGGTTLSTTATELTGDDTVWASFLVDDIMVISALTNVTGITQADGKVTALSAYVGNAGANQKFIVAAYGEDANGKAILKGVTTAKATETGTKTVALTNPLTVETGDNIKVYHWNMAELVPFSSVYSTTAQ